MGDDVNSTVPGGSRRKRQVQLNLSTKGHCFLCLRHESIFTIKREGASTSNQESSGSTAFSCHSLKTLCKILNVNVTGIVRDVIRTPAIVERIGLSSVERTDMKVSLCLECRDVAERFTGFAEDLERIKEGMEKCFREIKEKIADGGNDPLLVSSYQRQMTKDLYTMLMAGFIDELRKDINSKCATAKLNASMTSSNTPKTADGQTQTLNSDIPAPVPAQPFDTPMMPQIQSVYSTMCDVDSENNGDEIVILREEIIPPSRRCSSNRNCNNGNSENVAFNQSVNEPSTSRASMSMPSPKASKINNISRSPLSSPPPPTLEPQTVRSAPDADNIEEGREEWTTPRKSRASKSKALQKIMKVAAGNKKTDDDEERDEQEEENVSISNMEQDQEEEEQLQNSLQQRKSEPSMPSTSRSSSTNQQPGRGSARQTPTEHVNIRSSFVFNKFIGCYQCKLCVSSKDFASLGAAYRHYHANHGKTILRLQPVKIKAKSEKPAAAETSSSSTAITPQQNTTDPDNWYVIEESTEKFICSYPSCTLSFVTRDNVRAHYKFVHLNITYKCNICNRNDFQYPSYVVRHQKTCFEDKKSKKPNNKGNSGGAAAGHSSSSSLSANSRKFLEAKQKRRFYQSEGAVVNVAGTTGTTSKQKGYTLDTKTGKYKCIVRGCPGVFTSNSFAKIHYNAIHLNVRFTCPKCKRDDFIYPYNLRRHMKICNGATGKKPSRYSL